jgi:hypothetical protein
MTTHVHLVGSIGLDSVEEVFTTVGETIGPYLKRCPDGEVGSRRLWVSYQYPLLRATAFLDIIGDTAMPGIGLCQLRLKPRVTDAEIRFSELGYVREARTSYQDFCSARANGLLPATARFQVCLPTPWAVIGSFVVAADSGRVLPAYERAMLREVERLCAVIPQHDLALQWDVCIEMLNWDGRFPMMPAFPRMAEVFAGQFARLSAAVPTEVEMGIHLCYGDFEAKHFVEPLDTRKMVELANLFMQHSPRPLTWLHVPVPMARDDAAYFAPLADLHRGPNTELYLGLVHATDGTAGTLRRMQAARTTVSEFGIATECGMGRSRTPDMVRALLRVHGEAARQAG